jgi:hypothetical protein
MTMFRPFLALALAARVAAAQPPAPTAAEMRPAEVARWVAFFDKLVDVVVKDRESCEQMAIDVSAVIDANQDGIEAARAARLAHKKLPQGIQQHMLEGVRKMGPGIERCADNAHVKAAFAKLETAPDHRG